MKLFESPSILRMFGICVEDGESKAHIIHQDKTNTEVTWSLPAGPSPQFLIITEYCERGSLRQVLDSDELSWTTKTQMCLDAAQGLYRSGRSEVLKTYWCAFYLLYWLNLVETWFKEFVCHKFIHHDWFIFIQSLNPNILNQYRLLDSTRLKRKVRSMDASAATSSLWLKATGLRYGGGSCWIHRVNRSNEDAASVFISWAVLSWQRPRRRWKSHRSTKRAARCATPRLSTSTTSTTPTARRARCTGTYSFGLCFLQLPQFLNEPPAPCRNICSVCDRWIGFLNQHSGLCSFCKSF